jgi:DnaB-like helicase N terminal domain/AAA domain
MNPAPLVSSVDRIPPNSIAAEMALLGSVLVDPGLIPTVRGIVEPADFYASLHEAIFLAIDALYARGEPLDKIALAEELRLRGMLDNVGGIAYLTSLMDTVPTTASATYYARLVREKAAARALIRASAEIASSAYESEGDVAGAVDAARQRILSVVQSLQGVDEDGSWAPRSALDIATNGVPATEWDIEGMLTRNDGPALAVGPPESYKSWLALEATRCAVTGEPFAGRFPVRKRPYGIYVNLDAGRPAIERRVYMTACESPNLLVVSPGEWNPRKFEQLLSTHPGAFVTIDCFSDVFRQDPNQDPAEAMRQFLRDLRSLYAKYDCNGIVVDHSKRGNGARGATPDYYGSVQKKGAIRMMWVVEPVTPDEADPAHRQARILCEKMSEAEKFSPVTVEFAFTESSVAVSFAGSSGPVKVLTSKDVMLAKIDAEGPVTREQLGANGGKAKTDFDELLKMTKIKLTGTKVGRKLLYWTPERVAEALQLGSALNPVHHEPGKESSNGAGSNRVLSDNPVQPDAPTSADATALRVSESVATGARASEPGSGFSPIGNPVRQPGSFGTEEPLAKVVPLSRPPALADLASEPMAPDGFSRSTLACSYGGHRGRVRPSDGLCKRCVAARSAPDRGGAA